VSDWSFESLMSQSQVRSGKSGHKKAQGQRVRRARDRGKRGGAGLWHIVPGRSGVCLVVQRKGRATKVPPGVGVTAAISSQWTNKNKARGHLSRPNFSPPCFWPKWQDCFPVSICPPLPCILKPFGRIFSLAQHLAFESSGRRVFRG
jgi:hypothetical protein